MWFLNQKRADRVASSIAQFIHTLAVGREHDGPIGPERLLRGLAPLLGEDTIIGQRVVKLLIGLAGKAKFFVSLATVPDHSSHRLTIDGRGGDSGFSLPRPSPPRPLVPPFPPLALPPPAPHPLPP